MHYFSSACLSWIAVTVLNSSNAWADHEPHAYSYNGARSRTNIIEFAPSAEPRLLTIKSIGSDQMVNRKMDDLLEGFFSQAIAGIVVKGEEVLYQKYKKGEDTNLYPAWSMTKSLVSLTVGHALCTRVRHQMAQVIDSYRARFKLATTKGSTGCFASVF
jgi:hypothetical protein